MVWDFNILETHRVRTNVGYEDWLPFRFNAIIDSLDFRELDLSNKKYNLEKYQLMKDLIKS